MGTISEKLDALAETKENIAMAINAMGVEVTGEDTFASYADKIASIHIPTNVSELANDSGYQTADEVNAAIEASTSTKADLVDGVVPSSQLPSYVDDVLEYNGFNTFPTAGESGKIYLDTSTNIIYRWSGTAYIEITNPIDYATESEAIAGTNDVKVMTPLKTKAAIDNSLVSISEAIATNAENIEKVQAGAMTSVSWEDIQNIPSVFAPEEHTHNYAGSSTAGGAATSADKLNANAGGPAKPIYFKDGIPVECTSLELEVMGTSEAATKDGNGNVIVDTYATKTDTYTKTEIDNLIAGNIENKINTTTTDKISAHNIDENAHEDIRAMINEINAQIGDIASILDAINGEVI